MNNPTLQKSFRSGLLIFCLSLLLTTAQAQKATYSNPVLAGDYPDPSIIRVGNDYWATATTSQWGPVFPILHSRDLVNWKTVGSAMMKRPAWSDGSYWAPEIWQERGRYFIYYTARKRGGPLCVAVATATKPSGPYTDRGPLICQEVGSIDAMPIRDEKGRLYLVWKEDGNSVKKPTPLWAQPLSSDGTKLIGEKREILRNDAAWEDNLVEGPFIMRHGDYFYMFYSGNACCGRRCNYALGVARSKALLGPWDKNPANPILNGNNDWKCPGHGSIVTDSQRRTFLLYHAYHPEDFVYAGRQMLLDEVKWGNDGWPIINDGKGPSKQAASPFGVPERNNEYSFIDDFNGVRLTPGWQWPQAQEPQAILKGGWLYLAPSASQESNQLGAVVAHTTTLGDYTATTIIDTSSLKPGTIVGLSAYGNPENALGIAVSSGKVILWRRENNQHQEVAAVDAPKASLLHLRLDARDGSQFKFSVSSDGKSWREVGDAKGEYLPPWDLAVRVALTTGGSPGAVGRFDYLRITPAK